VPRVTSFHRIAALWAISPIASVIIRNATPRARTATQPVGIATRAVSAPAASSCTAPMSETSVEMIAPV
jgi:hypothetical protein